MPDIVRCFDDYFAEKKRDLYFITFGKSFQLSLRPLGKYINHEELDNIDSDPPGREEIIAWLAEHLPNTEVAPLFPISWDSGIICLPYDGTISVDFDDESLAIFIERWEDNSGKSLDPRMQCRLIRLATYLDLHDGVYPTPPDFENMWLD